MISPEQLRRYTFFAGLEYDQIVTISKLTDEETVEEGHYFFHEGELVDKLYMVVDGAVGIVIEIPDQAVQQSVSGQLTGQLQTRDISVSAIGAGMVFGWPGIIPPEEANASAKSLSPCRVYAIDCVGLHKAFESDRDLAFKITLKAAQIIRERLRDMQIESLSFLSN